MYNKVKTLIGVLLLFVLSLFVGKNMGYELFPLMDVGQLEVYVRLESGTRLEKTDEVIADIEEEVKSVVGDELNMIVSNIGVFYDWPAAYTPNSGSQDAFMKIQLKEGHKIGTRVHASRLRKRLNEAFPGVEFSFNTGGIITAALNYGTPSPIAIQIRGNDLAVANQIARSIRDEVRNLRGARDVRILQRQDQPQIDVELDRIKAAEMGVHAEDAVKNIVSSLNSSTVFAKAFWIDERNGNHYFVGVTYPEHLIDNELGIGQVGVRSNIDQKSVPVKNFSTLKHTTASAEVNHLNLTRVTDLHVNVENRDIGSLSSEISGILDNMTFPKGYEVEIRGEIEQMEKSFANLGLGLLLAIILSFLIIVPLFRSFKLPFIILLTVPLGLIGVFFFLAATNTNISIQSIMGVIMMVGISVSYGNILVDRINNISKEGVDITQAIMLGCKERFRPVLMTTLTTILGLLPMALGWQIGGEANVPLARAIMGGVFASSFLTLLIIPIFYYLFSKNRKPSHE